MLFVDVEADNEHKAVENERWLPSTTGGTSDANGVGVVRAGAATQPVVSAYEMEILAHNSVFGPIIIRCTQKAA